MANAAEKSKKSNASYLPLGIVSNILLRLPVKSLIRSTSVCKSWYSLITSPNFINTQLQYTISNHYSVNLGSILVLPIESEIDGTNEYNVICDTTFAVLETINFLDQSSSPVMQDTISSFNLSNSDLILSCNGLILLTDHSCKSLYICNPSIKKVIVLPSADFADDASRRGSFSDIGFGFDKINNDYKVVRIHYLQPNNSDGLMGLPPKVEVYSLRTGSWRSVEANIPLIASYQTVSCDGCIYWCGDKSLNDDFMCVMTFDTRAEVFGELTLPAVFNKTWMDFWVASYRGSFALIVMFDSLDFQICNYDIWVLKEYGVPESMTKMFTVSGIVPSSCGFTRSGRLIMIDSSGRLVSWDPENQLNYHEEMDCYIIDVDFMESLVLLEGANRFNATT